MDTRSQPFRRALRLLWNRMGPGRVYVAIAAVFLFILATIGLTHLVSSTRMSTSQPATPASSAKPAARAAEVSPPPSEPVIAITEIGSTETRDRNGQLNVAVRIGVAPRPHKKKGEVEIRVSFFDVTPSGEMRPTDAQVDYQWLTPVRDWADPSPKYLVATYLGAGTSRKAVENLRYGGFLVRVFFDGQLQAEQSEPKALVTALHNQLRSSPSTLSTPTASANVAVAPVRSPLPRQPESLTPQSTENQTVPKPPIPSPSLAQANRDNSSALPYGSPVPDKPGFVYSPYNPKFLIDVRGFPPGTEVTDPNTGKVLKVP